MKRGQGHQRLKKLIKKDHLAYLLSPSEIGTIVRGVVNRALKIHLEGAGRGSLTGFGFYCENAEDPAAGSSDTHPSPGLDKSAGDVFTDVQAV
jgi:hypothetical protein